LRVTEKGHKSWSLHYRMGGRLRRLTIGTYPAIKPPHARRLAQRALDRVGEGVDPGDEKRAQREVAAQGAQADDFPSAVRDYLARLERNTTPATHREATRILEREAAKAWHKRTLTSITRNDVNQVIDAALARGAEVHANRVLTRLRAFFNWAVERGRLSTSPAAGMRPPTKEQPRDRVLSDDETRVTTVESDH
jgi:Arm DNA-binding domain